MNSIASVTLFFTLFYNQVLVNAQNLRGSSASSVVASSSQQQFQRKLPPAVEWCDGESDAQMTTFDVGDAWSCDDKGNSNMRVYYPVDKTDIDKPKSYNVVLFMRGSGGWDEGYDKWLCDMAKQDLIVLAPMAGNSAKTKSTECKQDADLQTAYDWAKDNLNLDHVGIKGISSDAKIGIGGHSAGGHHIPMFLENYMKGFTVSAALFSHSGRDLEKYPSSLSKFNSMNIPTMFITSKDDEKVVPEKSKKWYDLVTSKDKMYVSLASGNHHEPHHDYQLSKQTGAFFGCKLNGENSKACKTYDNTKNDVKTDDYDRA